MDNTEKYWHSQDNYPQDVKKNTDLVVNFKLIGITIYFKFKFAFQVENVYRLISGGIHLLRCMAKHTSTDILIFPSM